MQPRRRPVYVIAHRCNDRFTSGGSASLHAFECDVRSSDGRVWWLDHDGIFPWSTPLDERWLATVAETVRPALIEFDVKTPTVPLDSLLASVRRHLPATRLLVACQGDDEYTRYSAALATNAAELKVSAPLTFALPPKTWIAYGTSALTMPFERAAIEQRLRAAATCRPDLPRAVWTLDDCASVRRFFELGVDSVTVDRSLLADALAYVRASPTLMLATSMPSLS